MSAYPANAAAAVPFHCRGKPRPVARHIITSLSNIRDRFFHGLYVWMKLAAVRMYTVKPTFLCIFLKAPFVQGSLFSPFQGAWLTPSSPLLPALRALPADAPRLLCGSGRSGRGRRSRLHSWRPSPFHPDRS